VTDIKKVPLISAGPLANAHDCSKHIVKTAAARIGIEPTVGLNNHHYFSIEQAMAVSQALTKRSAE
jgi:hypothetical protein